MFSDIAEKVCLEAKLRGFSEHTVKTYVRNVELFFASVQKRPEKVKVDDIKRYLVGLMDKGLDNRTVCKVRAALRFYFDEVLQKGLVGQVKAPKFNEKLPENVLGEILVIFMVNSVQKIESYFAKLEIAYAVLILTAWSR